MPETAAGAQADFRNVVAIVVEANKLVRDLAAHVLADLGIADVRRVATEKEGLKAFSDRPAHVVIVEYGPDHADARRLLELLRKSPYYRHGETGLIALVPHPDRETVLEVHAAGAEAVVAEPFSPSQLAEHVRAVVRRHQGHAVPAPPAVAKRA